MSRSQTNVPRRAGFTLVEVLISIAIALVLILGISQIFSLAQRTTGAGNAVLGAVDTVRGVQATFAQDFRSITNATGDSPGIAIVSYALPAWRSAADRQSDRDGTSYTYNDPASSGSLPAMNYTQVNDRIHRLDKIVFFARDRYARQTGDGSNLVTPMTSSEAMISIGHAAVPNDSGLAQQAKTGAIQTATTYYNNPADSNKIGRASCRE